MYAGVRYMCSDAVIMNTTLNKNNICDKISVRHQDGSTVTTRFTFQLKLMIHVGYML